MVLIKKRQLHCKTACTRFRRYKQKLYLKVFQSQNRLGKLEKATEKETYEFQSSENSQQTNSAALSSALNIEPES